MNIVNRHRDIHFKAARAYQIWYYLFITFLLALASPAWAQSEINVITVPMEVIEPGNPESTVYCTLADDSGSYEVHLTDNGGETMTLFDRICIQYQEFIKETRKGRRYRAIEIRMNVRQKDTIRKAESFTRDVDFDTEFFHKSDPTQRLVYFNSGDLDRVCMKNHIYPLFHTARFGNTPEILPQAANRGLLHIAYYEGEPCP